MTDEQLETLRQRGRGILSDALTRPVEGTHNGNESARQQAIGQTFSRILESWDRLMQDVTTLLKEQSKEQSAPKPVAAPAVIPMAGRTNR